MVEEFIKCKQTNEDFLAAGYTRWDPPGYEECVTDIFQKCVYDEDGYKKYFITVERWDYSPVAKPHRPVPIRYEWSVQFVHKPTGETVNIDCLNGWEIEEAEAFYEDLWRTGWFYYYDKYDGDQKV